MYSGPIPEWLLTYITEFAAICYLASCLFGRQGVSNMSPGICCALCRAFTQLLEMKLAKKVTIV